MSLVERLSKVALIGAEWVMWLLLALSVASIAAIVERWWFFRRRDDGGTRIGEKLCALLEEGDHAGADSLLAANRSIEARVVRRSLRWVKGGPAALANAIESELMSEKAELERGLNLLGTLGNNAPFIGLLGTVIGVIVAFHQLGAGQDKQSMGHVMNGISEALVATGVGLFVAIPAVVAYNVFQKKVGDVENNVGAISKRLTALLEATAHERSLGATASASRSASVAHAPVNGAAVNREEGGALALEGGE